MCKQIDKRLHILENNDHNFHLLLPLPMDCLENINNFEIILVSEQAQSQLVCIILSLFLN